MSSRTCISKIRSGCSECVSNDGQHVSSNDFPWLYLHDPHFLYLFTVFDPQKTWYNVGLDFAFLNIENRKNKKTFAERNEESRNVDLTNNGMGNHYLRDVDHLPTVFRDKGPHLYSNGNQVCRTVCRTVCVFYYHLINLLWVKFRDYTISRVKFCSSVTKVEELILFQTSQFHKVLWRSPVRHFVCRSSETNTR